MRETPIKIGSRLLSSRHPPLIVAEISANHNQSLDRALEIVEAAKLAGADAIKLQTYTPDTMTLNINTGDFFISDKNSLWSGKSLYELYQEAYTPWEWHAPIFARCKELGLIGFSTPFDATAVDFLETLDVPCYKIASFEITDLALIKKTASTGKPLMLSTGAATLEEIDDAVTTAFEGGCQDLVLLKCTAAYPAPAEEMNLRTIPYLADSFNALAGLSDHTAGIGVAIASIPFGACVIEKHFTLSRDDGGVDSAFSLNPTEFKALVTECQRAWQALGQEHFGPTQSELSHIFYRRSLYFVQDLPEGSIISKEHIRAIRPGRGLPPKELDRLIGRRVSCDVKRGDAVHWEVLEYDKKAH